jgi:predicted Ser/Thr protein kinase
VTCPSCHAENPASARDCARCGRALLPTLTAGSIVASRYEILALLGTGGMGVVYKAHDRALDDVVALKVLREEFARTGELGKRFRSEIRLARKVTHRNVCRIHEYGEDRGHRYISMEFVDGVNLKELVVRGGGLPLGEAYDAAIQTAEGLQAIHEAGIIHRDLKTPNIMRDNRGTIRLMDFGIAKELGAAGLTVAGQLIGTPEYMSPEQALGQKVDFRTDIYSLGIVTFEVFTGQVPFHGDTPVATVYRQVQEAAKLEGRVPNPLIPVLAKALAKKPADRHPTARGLAMALSLARESSDQQIPRAERPAGTAPRADARAEEGRVAAGSPRPRDESRRPAAELAGTPGWAGAGPRTPAPSWPAMPAIVLGPFVDALRDRDKSVRWRAALALGEVGPEASEAAALALIDALRDSDEGVRWAAAASLGRLGALAKDAVPALVGALGDDAVSEQARESLVKIGVLAVPALIDAIEGGDDAVRWRAADALTRIGVSRQVRRPGPSRPGPPLKSQR